MLDWSDPRWTTMEGGYRVPVDIRPFLMRVAAKPPDSTAWYDLIGELYHQGDVGQATYAAVPHLVRMLHEDDQPGPVELYQCVATIELARDSSGNPEIAEWLLAGYSASLRKLTDHCYHALKGTTKPDQLRGMLGLILIDKGLRVYAHALVEYAQDELTSFFLA